MPMVFSDAPKSMSSGVFSGMKTATRTSPQKIVAVMPEPTQKPMFLVSFLPWLMFMNAAQPSPRHHAKAWAMTKIGKTMPVAALPKVLNSLFPIKIWSTMLYKALTSNDSTQGSENLNISLDIFSLPKYSFPSVCTILFWFLRIVQL